MTALGWWYLGFGTGLALTLGWTWAVSVWYDVSWSAFWRPVRDVTMHGKPWLRVHLVAHLLGGVLAALFLLGPWWSPAWAGAWWQRGLWLLGVQAMWERIQHENWRDGGGSSAYPWWSAVWDLLITLVGWVVVELVRWVA